MKKLFRSLILMLISLLPFSASADRKWEAPVPPGLSGDEIVLADTELLPEHVEKTRVVYASELYGFWVEARTASSGKSSEMTGYYERSFTETLGMYAVVFKDSTGYSEFYAGPKWKPFSWLEVGVGVGREAVPDEPSSGRRNVFFSIDRETFSVYGTFEKGGSGSWRKVIALYKAEPIDFGLMYETNLGLGPRLEYNITKDIRVWGAMLHDKDTQETTSLFAINFSF